MKPVGRAQASAILQFQFNYPRTFSIQEKLITSQNENCIRPALKIPEVPLALSSFREDLDANFQSQRFKFANVPRA